MAGHNGTDSELTKRYPVAKPFSTTYSGQSVMQHSKDSGSESDKHSQRAASEGKSPADDNNAGKPRRSIDTERVQWADETDILPDSPGATIRKAKASVATTL